RLQHRTSWTVLQKVLSIVMENMVVHPMAIQKGQYLPGPSLTLRKRRAHPDKMPKGICLKVLPLRFKARDWILG
ncbi:hypothetical protein Tco_1401589, partial [Tanacetum coccineum]